MPTIEVRQLTKSYRTYKKRPGLGGAIRGLFKREYEELMGDLYRFTDFTRGL